LTLGEITGNEKPVSAQLFNRIMRSLLMTEAYNHAEELRTSLEADLEIMESFEKLMELDAQIEAKVEKKRKAVVKHLHYRRTA
jgi:hypothetical protein